ncbi:MAG: PucR family transcriptional regulator [Actinomycetales bacterium]
MPVSVREVVAAPTLALSVVNALAAESALDRQVRWVSVTELADPRPFLEGGELVLTTGLRMRTAAAQREFVARLVEADVAAVGFAVGLSHAAVPQALLAAASEAGLPVLEVPYETPFLGIDRFVADRITQDTYAHLQRLLATHDALSQALLTGSGLHALVSTLRRAVGGSVAVLDALGAVLAASPAASSWPVEQILRNGADSPDTSLIVLPAVVDDVVAAYLCVRRPATLPEVLPYAVNLVGLELARRQAELTGRRELVGQVLEDLARGAVTPAEAGRRLGAHGLDAEGEHVVVVGRVSGGEQRLARLRSLPWAAEGETEVLSGSRSRLVSALVDRALVLVVPAQAPVRELAQVLHDHLRRLDPAPAVGVGGRYRGVAGLRWSWWEAQEAAARGPGINEREPLTLSGLILASQDLPLRELGVDLLRPLLDFDAAHDGALLPTLRCYLEGDGSVREVAASLFVHENTVRYRLARIEALLGRRLGATRDRVQLWLALQSLDVGATPSAPPQDSVSRTSR